MARRQHAHRVRQLAGLAGMFCAALALAQVAPAPGYPPTRRVEVTDNFHGERVADPYRWLEAHDTTEVKSWVAAQNRIAQPLLRDDPARAAIRARLDQIGEAWPDESLPVRAGKREFLLGPDPADQGQALFLRDRAGGDRRLAIARASLPRGHALKAFVPAPDGKQIAYTSGPGGTDWGEIRIRDLERGADLPEVLVAVRFAGVVAWSADGRGFLYRRFDPPANSRYDAPATGAAIWRHRLGTPQAQDRRVHALPADRQDWSLAHELDATRRRLFIHTERGPWLESLGGSRREVALLAVDATGLPEPDARPAVLTPSDAAYQLVHAGPRRVVLLTDREAPRRRLVEIDLRRPQPGHWRTLVAQGEDPIRGAYRVGDEYVLHRLRSVQSQLERYHADGTPIAPITLPGIGVVDELVADSEAGVLRFFFSSIVQPPIGIRHELASGRSEVELRGRAALDLGAYELQQLWFRSPDGTRVPMFVAARRDLVRDGSHRALLHGYGASGDLVLPRFDESVVAWMERGGVYAVANVRGGGELGRDWYQAATREHKQRSFDDFIAAAGHLIAEGWTSPARLAISGASNGGLLVSASMLQRPALFAAVLADVPVTDVLRRSRSGTGAVQADQWGLPDDPVIYRAMRAYSPLHNVVAGRCYPATLITTAADDDRLPPWHAYKLAAALQAAQGCPKPILLHVRERGGHGGSGDFEAWFDDRADALAFAERATAGARAGADAAAIARQGGARPREAQGMPQSLQACALRSCYGSWSGSPGNERAEDGMTTPGSLLDVQR